MKTRFRLIYRGERRELRAVLQPCRVVLFV